MMTPTEQARDKARRLSCISNVIRNAATEALLYDQTDIAKMLHDVANAVALRSADLRTTARELESLIRVAC